MEADGTGVEVGTAHQGLPQLSSPVSVTTVSDIPNMLCAHNCPTEYCHNYNHYPVFVPPPEGEYIACNILQQAWEAHEVSVGPITGYTIDNDDSDKENNPNAAEVPPQLQGQGVVCMVDAEKDTKKVDEVWEMQKKALSDSTILGKHTWLEYKWAAVHLPSLASSSSIKAPHTSPSPSPLTRDKGSLPSIFQST